MTISEIAIVQEEIDYNQYNPYSSMVEMSESACNETRGFFCKFEAVGTSTQGFESSEFVAGLSIISCLSASFITLAAEI